MRHVRLDGSPPPMLAYEYIGPQYTDSTATVVYMQQIRTLYGRRRWELAFPSKGGFERRYYATRRGAVGTLGDLTMVKVVGYGVLCSSEERLEHGPPLDRPYVGPQYVTLDAMRYIQRIDGLGWEVAAWDYDNGRIWARTVHASRRAAFKSLERPATADA